MNVLTDAQERLKAETPELVELKDTLFQLVRQIDNGRKQDDSGPPSVPHMPVRTLGVYAGVLTGALLVNGNPNVTATIDGNNLNLTTP
jgi:hypothetical protein